ncbi:MAG: glycosyltransferase family 25 protein [Desulfomicrobium sp.]|nr:glycosyltransferase family 25 protein [Desulfomicrobium sp.]
MRHLLSGSQKLNDPKILPVYVVSLEQDIKRRAILKEQFPLFYDQFIRIKAIDGRKLSADEYFNKTLPFFKKYNRPMSPAELGATLSHIQALEDFLKTNAAYALILEDDVLGSDENIRAIQSMASFLPAQSVLLCGLQYNDSISKFRRGKKVKSLPLYKISTFSHPYVWGSYAYVVTRFSAQHILDKHRSTLVLSDKYDYFMDANMELYVTIQLQHPENRELSNIQGDRDKIQVPKKSFLQKIMTPNLPIKIVKFLWPRLKLLLTMIHNEKLPEN